MAGQLSRKTWEGLYHSRTVHIYGSVEGHISIHRQQYEEEGKNSEIAVFMQANHRQVSCFQFKCKSLALHA